MYICENTFYGHTEKSQFYMSILKRILNGNREIRYGKHRQLGIWRHEWLDSREYYPDQQLTNAEMCNVEYNEICDRSLT